MNEFGITLDIDWAPDFVIDEVAALLSEAGVRATWFVTHASPAVDRLRERPDLFELGIHPNFLPGSTHGASIADVLSHCMEIVPDATSMRTHALVQSSPLLAAVATETPIEVDVSLFLPKMPQLAPIHCFIQNGTCLRRIPYFWEDDAEMLDPTRSWRLGAECEVPGLKVFDFHPIHVYLNSPDMGVYMDIKNLGPLPGLGREQLAAHVFPGPGTRSYFLELLARLRLEGGGMRIRDIAGAMAAAPGAEARA